MASKVNVAVDVTKVQKSINAYLGWLSRREEALIGVCNAVIDNPSPVFIPQVVSHLAKVEEQAERIYTDVAVIVEAGSSTEAKKANESMATAAAAVAKCQVKAAEALRHLQDLFPQASAQVPASPASQLSSSFHSAASAPSSAYLESMKPFALKKTHTLTEYHSWKRKFLAWHRTLSSSLSSREEEVEQLRTCLASDLEPHVENKVRRWEDVHKMQMAVVSDDPNQDTWIKMLDSLFDEYNPIHARRDAYFRDCQRDGEAFSDFTMRLWKKGRVADLVNGLTEDEIYCHRYLVGCKNTKLREKLLNAFERDPKITVAKLDQVIRQFEATARTAKALDRTEPGSRTATSVDKKNSNMGGKPQKKNYQNPVKKMQGKCLACGSPNHRRADCSHKDAVCDKCRKRGHVSAVCCSESSNNQDRSRSKSQSRKASRRTSESPPRSRRSRKDSPPPRRAASRAAAEEEGFSDDENGGRTSAVRALRSDVSASCEGEGNGSENDIGITDPTPRLALQVSQAGQTFAFKALPDSGATKPLVGLDLVEQRNLQWRKSRVKRTTTCANNTKMRILGRCRLRLDIPVDKDGFGGISKMVDCDVCESLGSDIYLG